MYVCMHKDGVYLSPSSIPAIAYGEEVFPGSFFAEIPIFPLQCLDWEELVAVLLPIKITPGNNKHEVNYLLIFWKSKEHKQDKMELQKKGGPGFHH